MNRQWVIGVLEGWTVCCAGVEAGEVKALADRVRAYQSTLGSRFKNQHWVRGTYYAGLMAMYESTSDRAYLDDCMDWGKEVSWRIKDKSDGPYDSGAYSLICGQIWYGCYQAEKDERMMRPTLAFLENPDVTNPLSDPTGWYLENTGHRFVDGLFTAPPALAILYQMTGDEKYVNWMDACFWDVHGKIFDNDAGLFYRDARSISRKTKNGKKVLWSRGNGWAFGGVTRVLKHLPQDHASYERYKALYVQMAESLATRQQADGFWRPNLDDPKQHDVRESTGTGFFTYGIAWGINNGILDRERFQLIATNGWAALASVVNEEGRIGWSQPPSGGPGNVEETDSTRYGAGIFLMAASEIIQLRASKPNVIIIYADDMGYGDLGSYGCKDIPTPNIDQLAAEGVRFTDGYVSAPQCAPSRVGLLSGKYQNRLGFEYNVPKDDPKYSQLGFPRDEETVGDLMKAQGYTTGVIGKWHMGLSPDLHPHKRGFDEFFGTLYGSSYFVPPFNMKSRKLKGPNKPKADIQHNGKEVDEREYLTDAFSREAVAFIDKYHDKPFFLYLPYTAPHGPLQASEKYLKRFPDIQHPKRKIYAAMVSSLDDGVGRIMAKLKERKLERNTLVFFISDNGATRRTSYGDNGPLRAAKGSLNEGGIRVPFIMTWKGTLPVGVVDSRPVIQLDATATAVDLAGGDISDMNGVNLMPYLLKQKDGVPHKQLFWRIMSWKYPKTGEPYQKATRRGDWKLVLTEKKWELFNLKDDISETKDLAAQHPELVEELKGSWNQWEDTVQFPHFPADSPVFPWKKLKAEAGR